MDSNLIFASIVLCILLPFNGYWFVILLIRMFNSRRYIKATERKIQFDNTDYISQQYNYHFKTEVCKQLMLVIISSMEISGGVLAYIHLILEKCINSDNIYKEELMRCASLNNSIILNFQFVESSYVLLTTARALRDLAEVLVLVLITSLMSYLLSRMKKSSHINFRRYICIICIIGIAIIITSYYTFLLALGKLAYLVVITYNCILFLIYVKRFKQSLLQAAIERLVQYGSNRIEMRQYTYFSYTMNLICIGILLILVATYLGIIARTMISFIFFGDCVFPTIFYPQLINLKSLNNEEISKIFTIFRDIDYLSSGVAYIGLFIGCFPLIFVTIAIWVRSIARITRRECQIQHRYQVISRRD